MRDIKIIINDDGYASSYEKFIGIQNENEATRLVFDLPDIYKKDGSYQYVAFTLPDGTIKVRRLVDYACIIDSEITSQRGVILISVIIKSVENVLDIETGFIMSSQPISGYIKKTILDETGTNSIDKNVRVYLDEFDALLMEIRKTDARLASILDSDPSKYAEVIDARGGYTVLKNRLDAMLSSINNNYNNIESNSNKIVSNYSTLLTKINAVASGSPLVASSTSGMTDTKRVYVNTSDGNWYYFDGSNWASGGVYQATAIDDFSIKNKMFAEEEITLDKLDIAIDLLSLAVKIEKSKRISAYNTTTKLPVLVDDNNTDVITFKRSDILGNISFYMPDVAETTQIMVAYTENINSLNFTKRNLLLASPPRNTKYDSSTNMETLNLSKFTDYEYIALTIDNKNSKIHDTDNNYTNDKFNNYINELVDKKNIINEKNITIDLSTTNLLEKAEIIYDKILNGYNTTSFEVITARNTNYYLAKFKISDLSKDALRNLKYLVPKENASVANVIIANTPGSKASNITRTQLVNKSTYDAKTGYVSLDLSPYEDYEYLTVVCGYDNQKSKLFIDKLTTDNPNYNMLGLTGITASVNMFNNIAAIGDSYTAGSLKKSDDHWVDVPNQSYVATMAKRAGITYGNYGVGGATTRSYLTASNGLSKVLAANAHDFYFLALGINDCEQLGIDYLGSIEDITSDYTQNPDTFYGNFARIIEQVQAHAPLAKLTMIKIPLNKSWGSIDASIYTTFSGAIEKIANHYGIPCINPFDDPFFNSPLYAKKIGGHPTCLGYSSMGLAYERLFSKVVNENIDYFFDCTVG